MPGWPDTLPKFKAEGYGRAPQPAGVRFQPERGPAKQRRTTRAAPWNNTFQLELTAAQLAIFWAFWEDDCASGALSFTMNDPITGAEHDWRFIIDQPPQESLAPPWHVISFSLERLV